MSINILIGILIPFIGTTLGAACVFLIKDEINPYLQKSLLGFASGVMVAASVWSLIIPSIEMSEGMGTFSFVPAATGIFLGMILLLCMDKFVPHMHLGSDEAEGIQANLKKTTKLVFAVTLHNIPEGMAVGVVFAGAISALSQSGSANGTAMISLSGAIALSVGIAIQNFPEGAIISLPLKAEGNGKLKAFVYGTLSGAVEPLAAIVTIAASSMLSAILPYLLAFAAGAMLYVVVEELIPEASEGEHTNIGTIGFGLGFILMMVLDVALG